MDEPDLENKWELSKHKGYCTKLHTDLLMKWGAHHEHRRSYRPVKIALGLPLTTPEQEDNKKKYKTNKVLYKNDLSKLNECIL